jgi:hypothetical protein
MKKIISSAIGLSIFGIASIALASVTFNSTTGAGFVGKGDVQTIFGWNNATLQTRAASVAFRTSSSLVTEVSWICTNENNEHTQERSRTTSKTVQGLIESIARVKSQITGFNLTGYSEGAVNSESTGGPALNSCPNGPWSLTTPAGEPVVVSSEGNGLEVSPDGGTTWFPLPITPIVTTI